MNTQPLVTLVPWTMIAQFLNLMIQLVGTIWTKQAPKLSFGNPGMVSSADLIHHSRLNSSSRTRLLSNLCAAHVVRC